MMHVDKLTTVKDGPWRSSREPAQSSAGGRELGRAKVPERGEARKEDEARQGTAGRGAAARVWALGPLG